jgi:hypothetical protein
VLQQSFNNPAAASEVVSVTSKGRLEGSWKKSRSHGKRTQFLKTCADFDLSGDYRDAGAGVQFVLTQTDCQLSFDLAAFTRGGTVYKSDAGVKTVVLNDWPDETGELQASGDFTFTDAAGALTRRWELLQLRTERVSAPGPPPLAQTPSQVSGQQPAGEYATTIIPFAIPLVQTTIQVATDWVVVPVTTAMPVETWGINSTATDAPATSTTGGGWLDGW